jgi:hypothetical protein
VSTLHRLFAFALVALFTVGCGGVTSIVVEFGELNPPAATIQVSGTQQLEVVLTEMGANQIEWSIAEPNGGTITPSGENPPRSAVYTAPTTPGTYQIRARIITNTRVKTVKSEITVTPVP